jgi:hypothetical protein
VRPITVTQNSPSALALWVPSIAGGLIGLFVGDLVAEVHPNSRSWGVISKITGLVVGATAGTLLTPNSTAVPAYAATIATF